MSKEFRIISLLLLLNCFSPAPGWALSGYTSSKYVIISITTGDQDGDTGSGVLMSLSNNGNYWSEPELFINTNIYWDLTAYGGGDGDGQKKVYARLKDSAGNWTQIVAAIVLDRVSPVVGVAPEGGDYSSAQTVVLSADEAARIYYTTDGSLPENSSVLYNGSPLVFKTGTTLRFFAEDMAGNKSTVLTEVYNIAPQAPSGACGEGSVTCGVGVCERTVSVCLDGLPNTCIPGAPRGEVCDGLDNDCDGAVDEGLGSVACGEGVCERTVSACLDGMPDSCVPGDPTPEVCDGLDNDCNGLVDEVCRPVFEVVVDLNNDPVTVCFTTYQPLDEYPVVTLMSGQEVMSPPSGTGVLPTDGLCQDLTGYCLDYEVGSTDSTVSIRIDEDRNSAVIPADPGYELAEFLVSDPDHERAGSFCIYNEAGGSGSLFDERCERGLFVEYSAGVFSGPGLGDEECVVMRIVEIDPAAITGPPGTVVTGLYEIGLPAGVAIADGRSITVSLGFEFTAGALGPEDGSKVFEVFYYDKGLGSWEEERGEDIDLQWDSDTTGTITFTTTRLTTFAASVKQDGGQQGQDSSSANQSGSGSTQGASGAGGGCSLAPVNHDMSIGSAVANFIIFLLPLMAVRVRRRFYVS